MGMFRCGSLALLVTSLLFLGRVASADSPAAPVTLRQDATRVTFDNGIVSFAVVKANGNFEALRFAGASILAEPGYLDWIENGNQHISRGTFAVVTDPGKNAGALAEISVSQGFSATSAFDVEIHYVLRRGDPGPYCFVVFSHAKGYPAGGFGQARWVLRLNDSVFDFINVDEKRRFVLPPSNTPTRALGPKESLQFTEGPFAGQMTDKYQFYVDAGDHFFHGWTGTQSKLGCWVINGSNEARNGGPTKQHNDAQWGRLLFQILTCGHYGAAGIHVDADKPWQKMYGPWMLYLNRADTNDGLWADAQKKSEAARAAWPPDWMHHAAFPLVADRGKVIGSFKIADTQDPAASPAGAWVGLAAPAPDWQQQSDGYQFWVHADKEGHFQIPNVRAGQYTLYAFVAGVMGEFRRDKVSVGSGATVDLGALSWQPLRFGKQVWQIGTPDRSAAEFRHGDDYRHWGLWQEFPKDFPNGVNFVVGQSVERTDWNYAQVNVERAGQWVGTTWNVQFDLPARAAGTAILRLAMASTHNASLSIRVNEQNVDQFRTAADNAVIRAGIHGQYSEQDTFFDAGILHAGHNTLALTQSAGGNAQKSVMYDCLRLELDAAHTYDKSTSTAHPHVFPQSGGVAADAGE